ncbi:MAG: ribonuclease HI family protein [Candidatus Hodarchaeales archaeon]|jgi:ribonuclease HI
MPTSQYNTIIWFDGAARGNPGLAGAGAVFQSASGKEFFDKIFLNVATNNFAEYNALKLGLNLAIDYFKERVTEKVDSLLIYGDSELIIKQLKGEYRVKNKNLKNLYDEVQSMLNQIKLLKPSIKIQYEHIPREENKKADRLANQAIDDRL